MEMVSSDWNDDDCDKEGEHPSASSIAVACCLKSAALVLIVRYFPLRLLYEHVIQYFACIVFFFKQSRDFKALK
jgi:hypothetical protein